MATASVGHEIYTIGGDRRDAPGWPFNWISEPVVEVFDPERNTWRNVTPMPIDRTHSGGANVEGDVYVVGGFHQPNGTNIQRTDVLDLDIGTWGPAPPPPSFEPYEFGAAWDGDFLAVNPQKIHRLDPSTGVWYSSPLVAPNRRPAYALLGDQLYQMGGVAGGAPSTTDVYILDLTAGSWSLGPSLLVARGDHSRAAVLDGRIYIVGGSIGGNQEVLNEMEEYDPATGNWTPKEPMPTARDEFGLAVAGDWMCAFGGSNVWWEVTYNVTECYTQRLTYEWDFGDGSPTETGKEVQHAYAGPGTYTVTLTVTDGGGLSGTDTATVTIRSANETPRANAGGPYLVQEGTPLTLDSTGSWDPDGDVLTFEWDLDGDGVFETAGPSPTHTWGDDGTFLVRVRVSDGEETATATADVTVVNVSPSLDGDIAVYVTGDLILRVAGEKWHDVTLTLYQDDVPVATRSVIRLPGSPDDQAVTIEDVTIDLLGSTLSAVVEYTPLDDPVNGQPLGADPAWLIFTAEDGSETRLHHTFNVRHEDTWVWTVEDLRAMLVGFPVTFEASASDPGSDDLTFTWSWGDGSPDTVNTYYNDGLGPDPYPSPDVNPISVAEEVQHAFDSPGMYAIALLVEDDDGGRLEEWITIAL
jgi:PKD repeat protein